MKHVCILLAIVAGFVVPQARAVDLGPYVKDDDFGTIVISPTGEYYAATVPAGDRTGVVVMRRKDRAVTAAFSLGKNNHVSDIAWANDERVLLSIAQKLGRLARPVPTGELYAMNADGSRKEMLVGYRVESSGPGTRIQPKDVGAVFARVVDILPDDPKNVIISVERFDTDVHARVERMDVYNGRRTSLGTAPVINTSYATDNAGNVRFGYGVGLDTANLLYHRAPGGGEWKMVNDENVTKRGEWPIGFSADDSEAYLQANAPAGPDAIVAWNPATGARREVMRHARVDPWMFLTTLDGRSPTGAIHMSGKPEYSFFDKASKEARLYASLQAAFPGEGVLVTSVTRDGTHALIRTWSDRNPGDYYLFDLVSRKAEYVAGQRRGIDPDRMSPMRPITFKARDGLELTGYLTVPARGPQRALPLIVMPHGGPFGIADTWSFNDDVQILAEAGYAVLQVNFRGSGNRGRAFQQSGAGEWGGRMQDDLTDATRWAAQEGVADAGRICIYGASYGGYAALMGVAKEPALYRCAVGLVGVYDLPMMQKEDARGSRRLGNWSKDWVGSDAAKLAATSPNRIADRIKVPVFLSAGGEDEVAPIEHTRMMERAIGKAGGSVETLYFPKEGHGYYLEANRRQFYERLLAFLGKHLGTTAPVAAASAPAVAPTAD